MMSRPSQKHLQILYVHYSRKLVKPALAGKIDKYNEPEQVNQYTITNKTLGRGAQGTVKLAKDTSMKLYVV